ncbi:MAG: hypothetical protein ABJB40_03810 [Acidobacteriota bacterium]
MSDTADNGSENTPTFDPNIQTENIAFAPGELATCDSCGRKNPPTRFNCLYCAKELAVKIENVASTGFVTRKLELWERGYNLILRERSDVLDTPKVAQLLSMEIADLTLILEARKPLPLARVETESQTSAMLRGLAQLGLVCSLVSDADLVPDKPPVRLSGIEFFEDNIAFIDFNTGHLIEIKADELALIVPGLIIESRVDSLEKRGFRGKKKLVAETPTVSDGSILDIYDRYDAIGFRVHLAGFDFSCLGEDKTLLASENIRRLTVTLLEQAPHAKTIDDYGAVRQALRSVWEVETRNDTQGFERAGVRAVASTSNLNQFTKYSRLQWQLLKDEG